MYVQAHAIFEPMVHIDEIRIAFVARLKASLAAHGIDQWGAGARLAEITKVTPKASSKWLNGETMPGPAKMLAIADALGVRVEWLQHGSGEGPSPFIGSRAPAAQRRAQGDEVWIAHYDARGSVGSAELALDYPQMLQAVKVSPTHLRQLGIAFTASNDFKIVTGWGQSMAPTIKHNDPLLVDASIEEFVGDGIYLFAREGMLFLKRLQMDGPGHFSVISDNPIHTLERVLRDDIQIRARVLVVWSGNLV